MNRSVLMAALSALPVLALAAAEGRAAEQPKFRYQASAYVDEAGKGMREPEGVACGEPNTVLVADTENGRLLRYTFDGEKFNGGQVVALPERAYPMRVQLGPDGSAFYLDGRGRRVFRVSAEGAATAVGLSGVPAPAPGPVRSFRVGGEGELYLLDPNGWRVLVADTSGRYLRHLPLPPEATSAEDLALDSRGTIYVLDGVNGSVYLAPKDGQAFTLFARGLREFLSFSTNLTAEPRGGLYLTDQSGSGVVFLGPDGSFQARHGSFGWKEGLLRHPAQVCASSQGSVVIADRDNSRIQLFLTR